MKNINKLRLQCTHLTHEEREILFSGAAQRINQIETLKRMGIVAETGAYIIAGLVKPGTRPPNISPKNPIPPTPNGIGQVAFGKQIIKWGSGPREALARINTITRGELVRGGVTRKMAKLWRNFYQEEALANPRNYSATARASLMHHVLKLLKGN